MKRKDLVDLGSCSHHSGVISCEALILPNGRLAIFTDVASVNEEVSNGTFHGVAENLNWRPDLSAKNQEVWNSNELHFPNDEERKLIEAIGISVDDDFLLESEDVQNPLP